MKFIIALTTLLFVGGALADEGNKAEKKEDSPKLKAGKERLRECRTLFAEGKEDEAMELAQQSLEMFVAPVPELKSLAIGAIDTEKYRVEVHVNTTGAERAEPKPPITRPYSFVVYSKEDEPKFLYALDLEHGHDDGELASAALGRMHNGHINYGMVDTSAKFSEVKKRALALIQSGIENKD